MMETERSSTSRLAVPKSPFSVPKVTSPNTTTMSATEAPGIADLLMGYAIGMNPRPAASLAGDVIQNNPSRISKHSATADMKSNRDVLELRHILPAHALS